MIYQIVILLMMEKTQKEIKHVSIHTTIHIFGKSKGKFI